MRHKIVHVSCEEPRQGVDWKLGSAEALSKIPPSHDSFGLISFELPSTQARALERELIFEELWRDSWERMRVAQLWQ